MILPAHPSPNGRRLEPLPATGALLVEGSGSLSPASLLPGAPGTWTRLGPIVALDCDPVQSPREHECLAEQTIGGPESRADHRLVLHEADLRAVARVARRSLTWTAVLPCLGVRLEERVGVDGHHWSRLWLAFDRPRVAGPVVPGLDLGAGEDLGSLGNRWDPGPHHRRLGERAVGGPGPNPLDWRLFLASSELERFLQLAGASPSGAVRLDLVGVRLRLHRDHSGHVYAVVRLVHARPRPL